MRAVFVDTSAWDALEDSSDSNHAAAVRCRAALRQERIPLYVTN
jgi:predicted nucleic acid-binding protein